MPLSNPSSSQTYTSLPFGKVSVRLIPTLQSSLVRHAGYALSNKERSPGSVCIGVQNWTQNGQRGHCIVDGPLGQPGRPLPGVESTPRRWQRVAVLHDQEHQRLADEERNYSTIDTGLTTSPPLATGCGGLAGPLRW